MKNIAFQISLFSVITIFISCNEDFIDSFEYSEGPLPHKYWSEGCQGQIKNGHLCVDTDNTPPFQSTIWLDKELSGDLLIECDVHIMSSKETANNINFMFMYSDPTGKNLRETCGGRLTGAYESYHKLNGYIFTYLANSNPDTARFRFRDNPGFNLIEEVNGYECRAGKTYHIRIIKKGDRFQFWTDGFKAIDIVDNRFASLHKRGFFGFRTWHTALWWDNLSVRSN